LAYCAAETAQNRPTLDPLHRRLRLGRDSTVLDTVRHDPVQAMTAAATGPRALSLPQATALTDIVRSVIRAETAAPQSLQQRIDGTFGDACGCLLSCRGRIVVVGMGTSGHIARKIAVSSSAAAGCLTSQTVAGT
jgi:hypothetical protein